MLPPAWKAGLERRSDAELYQTSEGYCRPKNNRRSGPAGARITSRRPRRSMGCRGRLACYKVPEHIRFVDAWPMTLSGKLQKFQNARIRDRHPEPPSGCKPADRMRASTEWRLKPGRACSRHLHKPWRSLR